MIPTSTPARLIGKFLALAFMGGALVLGGCANGDKDKLSLYEQENNSLRQKMTEMDQNNQDMQAKLAQLEAGKGAPGQGGNGGYGDGTTVFTRGQDLVIGVAGDVLFASGKAALKPAAKKTLDRVAADLGGKYNSQKIRVEGYTDPDPIKKSQWKTNERLSGERAMAVEEYLVSKGVSKNRIYFAGFGAADSKGSKAQSRRVEIVVLGSAK